MKKLSKIILLLLLTGQVTAQANLPSIDYMPQSPEAAQYSRYGEIPVDYSTGVPKIQIPIYTINVGDVKVPITISYHASGIKVRDVASEVGLGFVLNAGEVITANIIGKPDADNLWPSGLKSSVDIYDSISEAESSSNTFELAWRYWNMLTLNSGLYDYFSDRYCYSLCTGESGIFRKDFITNEIRFLPYRPIKVELNDGYLNITSTNGYKHYFQGGSDLYTIRKIVSSDKTDSILYYYNIDNEYTWQTPSEYIMNWRHENIEEDPDGTCDLILNSTYDDSKLSRVDNSAYSQAPFLDSIVSSSAVISFQYVHDRQDGDNDGIRLVKIVVRDRLSRNVIKTVQLSHSYFGSTDDGNLRLRLDSLMIFGPIGENAETYSFNYNSIALPPYPTELQQENYYEDYWGYYNGSQSHNLLPTFFSNFDIPDPYNYANRDPDPNGGFTQACILTEINYPTGGRTIFEYEPNAVPDHYGQVVGGVRIKKIISYTDDTSKAFVKTYEYANAVTTQILPAEFKYQQECWVAFQGTDLAGNPVCPVVVASYNKEVGLSNSLLPITLSNGTPIIYNQVTEYDGDEGSNIGKTVYHYHYEDYDSRNPRPGNIDTRFFNYYHSDGGNYVPELTSIETYKVSGGNYELVKSEDNSYTTYRQREFNTGVNFGSTVEIGEENWQCSRDQAFMTYHQLYNYLSSLVYTDTKGYEEVRLLTSKVVKDYSGGSVLETTTNYIYDDSTTLLKSKVVTDSKGEMIKKEYKYPTDFPSVTPYSTMITRNILSPAIEQLSYKDNNFLESVKTNYNFWSNGVWGGSPSNMIVPETVDTRILNQSYETRIHYHAYDSRGNVLSVSKEGDAIHSYIWNYNKTYPVAEVTNAAQSDIAFASFESDGKGNWNYSGIPVITSGGITGEKAYYLGSGAVSKAGLASSRKYIISYWLKSGTVSLSGGSASNALTGNTVGGWTYHEITVTGATSISLNGSGVIDELRLYPSDALMTTYTYEPLIGMTGMCDVKNGISYYEYDDFGRLSTVRDENKNILKMFCYDYAGRPDACENGYYSVQKSGSFTKNNCGGGGIGSTLTYTVPANTYSSDISQADADQKAQDDVNTNGQAYANQHGSCIWWNVEKSGNFTKNDCSSGYGSAVTYTVAAHTYSSSSSQSDADQQAQNAVNSNGQAYANANGSCMTEPVQVYARLEVAYSSLDSSSMSSQYGGWEYDYSQLVSIYIRFYSDAACTQPYTLTHSVNYTINDDEHYETESGYDNSTSTAFQGTANAGASEVFIDDVIPFESFWGATDSNGDWVFYEQIGDEYSLTTGGGMIIATPISPTHTPGY